MGITVRKGVIVKKDGENVNKKLSRYLFEYLEDTSDESEEEEHKEATCSGGFFFSKKKTKKT